MHLVGFIIRIDDECDSDIEESFPSCVNCIVQCGRMKNNT
jgi:hypothetical protein